jgi:outer membrane lipoprotein-sorting protein
MNVVLKNILLLVFVPVSSFAQMTPKQLIAAAYNKFSQVSSYVANIHLQFNIPGVYLEPIQGKVYYKKPDKFRIQARGIIFLPKQHPYLVLQTVRDTHSFAAVISGEEKIGNVSIRVIHVIPNDAAGDLILAKLWIDEKSFLIHKAQLTTKQNGTISIEQFFGGASQGILPDEIKFLVDMTKFKVPKAMTFELNSKSKKTTEVVNSRGTGEIKLHFSHYKLNQVFSDTVFTSPQL